MFASACVCVCHSGDVTGAGERQPGRSDGQRPGGRRRGAGAVFAPSGRDLRRLRQSSDAQQQEWVCCCVIVLHGEMCADRPCSLKPVTATKDTEPWPAAADNRINSMAETANVWWHCWVFSGHITAGHHTQRFSHNAPFQCSWIKHFRRGLGQQSWCLLRETLPGAIPLNW